MLQLVIKAHDLDSGRRACIANGINPTATAQKRGGEVLALVEGKYHGSVAKWFCSGREEPPFAQGTLLFYSDFR